MSITENDLELSYLKMVQQLFQNDIEVKLEQAQNELDAEAQAEIDNKTLCTK